MLELKLYLHDGITLDQLRTFVEMTKDADGDLGILRCDMQGDIDSLGVVVDGR